MRLSRAAPQALLERRALSRSQTQSQTSSAADASAEPDFIDALDLQDETALDYALDRCRWAVVVSAPTPPKQRWRARQAHCPGAHGRLRLPTAAALAVLHCIPEACGGVVSATGHHCATERRDAHAERR